LKYLKITKSVRSATANTEIQHLIASSSKTLSHFEIQKLLEGLCFKVTIYCVVERLFVEGVIHKIDNVDGVLKYAVCHS